MDYRPYQLEAPESAFQELESIQSTLVVLPTGTGKTVVMRKMIEDARSEGYERIVVVVHKVDLVRQLANRLSQIDGANVAIEQAGNSELSKEGWNIAVCSIQTLQSRPAVLSSVRNDPDVLFCIDESHRAVADGYQETFDYLGSPKVCGFTATDYRGDEEPLSRFFDSIAYKKGVGWAMENHWLVRPKARRVLVEMSDGSEQTASEATCEKFLDVFADELMEVGRAKYSTIVMAPSVDEGRELETELQKMGVKARMVDSRMSDREKEEVLNAYRDREIDVLLNYAIVEEGFDAPHAECICVLRNMGSPVSYMQSIGRVLRPNISGDAFEEFNTTDDPRRRAAIIEDSSKPEAWVYDFVGTSSRFDLFTMGRIFGLDPSFDFEGEDAFAVAEELMDLAEAYGLSTDAVSSATEVGLVVEDAALWREATQPNVGVPDFCDLTYAKLGDTWRLVLPDPDEDNLQWIVRISQTAMGDWEAVYEQPALYKQRYYNPRRRQYGWKIYKGDNAPDMSKTMNVKGTDKPLYKKLGGFGPEVLGTSDTKERIFDNVEAWVWQYFPKKTYKIVNRDAPWRHQPPSGGQIKWLKKMEKKGIPLPPQQEITKGHASLLLDLFFAGKLKPMKGRKGRKRIRKRRSYV